MLSTKNLSILMVLLTNMVERVRVNNNKTLRFMFNFFDNSESKYVFQLRDEESKDLNAYSNISYTISSHTTNYISLLFKNTVVTECKSKEFPFNTRTINIDIKTSGHVDLKCYLSVIRGFKSYTLGHTVLDSRCGYKFLSIDDSSCNREIHSHGLIDDNRGDGCLLIAFFIIKEQIKARKQYDDLDSPFIYDFKFICPSVNISDLIDNNLYLQKVMTKVDFESQLGLKSTLNAINEGQTDDAEVSGLKHFPGDLSDTCLNSLRTFYTSKMSSGLSKNVLKKYGNILLASIVISYLYTLL